MRIGVVLVWTVAASAGCGGEPAEFVGWWRFQGVHLTIERAPEGERIGVAPTRGEYAIEPGLASELVLIDGPCAWPLEVAGDAATIRPGSSCRLGEDPPSVTFTVREGSLRIACERIAYTAEGEFRVDRGLGSAAGVFRTAEALERIRL